MEGEELIIMTGKINSENTQIPYSPMLVPTCNLKSLGESDNLGEILTGDYTYYSNYTVN